MFNQPGGRSTPVKIDRGPIGFLKGKAKAGKTLSLPPMEWDLGAAVPRMIEIELSPDNQEFLMMAHAGDSPAGLNEFINSLLRQERFRQGYPMDGSRKTPAKGLAIVPKLHGLAQSWFGKSRHAEP